MKRKVLTILLVLCVALTMMPTVAMADAPTPTPTPTFGEDWKPLTVNNGAISTTIEAGGKYYLSGNLEISSTFAVSVGTVENPVTLDLNGHVLKMTGTSSVIKVEKNANLIMQDSNPNAKHYFRVEQNEGNYYDYKMWIWDEDVTEDSSNVDAYKLVQGGVITGGKGSIIDGCSNGGGVLVDGGSFTLEKGNIVGCRGNDDSGGGGVYIRDGGSFYMKGGCIAGCNGCTSRGNGVYVYGNSEFHMSGGSIIDCYIQMISTCASVAVFDAVNEKGVFTMTGGEIRIDNGEHEPIAVKMHTGTMNADGGAVYGPCVIYSAKLTHRTDAQSATIFYDGRNYDDALDPSDNSADKGSNDKVIDFTDNGRLYAWEVVTVGNEAVKPAEPEGYKGYKGYTCEWYNGDEPAPYDFNSPVTKGLTLTLKQTPINYDISYELNGGILDTGKTNPGSYTVESEAITLNNPTKAGYTFLGWSGTGLTGENNMSVVIPKGSTENRSYTAHWQDNQPPTGEIDISSNSWDTLLSDVNFNTIFNDNQNVTITASDNSSDTVKIAYLLSDKRLSKTELEYASFTAYSTPLTIYSEDKYVIYAKLTDGAGNVTYISSDGFVIDKTKPSFDGLEDGETYRGDVTFMVSDGNGSGVKSVSVQSGGKNETLTADIDGKYTLKSGSGNVTVTATDNAGNKNTITVTVNSRGGVPTATIIQKTSISLGTDAKTEKAEDGTTVYTTDEGSIILSSDGRTAAIAPADGYEVANVSVNGKDMGAVTTLTGLRTGDEIVVSFQKTEETKKAEVKAAAEKLDSIARSVKTEKGNIKITVKFDKETESLIKEMQELGYTVKYKFYRSTNKSSGYKAMLTKSERVYTNTSGKAGTKYYYKARVQIYDQDGKLIAQTALKQCQYASRTWMK